MPQNKRLIAEILAERARQGGMQPQGMHPSANPAMAEGIHPLSSQPMGLPHPQLGMQATPPQYHLPQAPQMQMPKQQSIGAPQAPMKSLTPGSSLQPPKVNFPKLGNKMKRPM